jgi:hypothetical protein
MEDPARHVSVDQALALFRENLGRVQQLLARVVEQHVEDETRSCRRTLQGAIVTPRERMSEAQRALVDFLSL